MPFATPDGSQSRSKGAGANRFPSATIGEHFALFVDHLRAMIWSLVY